MSKNKNELKDLIKNRYIFKDKESDQKALDELNTEVHFPYTDKQNNKHYLVKLKFSVCIEAGNFVKSKSKAVVENVVVLDQKVIALRHPIDQENLRYYYNRGNKLGGKK